MLRPYRQNAAGTNGLREAKGTGLQLIVKKRRRYLLAIFYQAKSRQQAAFCRKRLPSPPGGVL